MGLGCKKYVGNMKKLMDTLKETEPKRKEKPKKDEPEQTATRPQKKKK